MNTMLERKRQYEADCEAAVKAGRKKEAIICAARAAELAFKLAERTDGAIAQRYVEDAEGWLEIGEKLKAKGLKTGGSGQRTEAGGQKSEEDKKIQVSSFKSQVSPEDDSSEGSEWLIGEKPNMTFDKICGMVDAKEAIMQMVVYPLKQPEKSQALGLNPGGGVLLYGPPGNGKTLLGKAIAGELDCPFFYASGAQIRSKWHGESEQRLSKLLKSAQACQVAVLFLDEVEGLLPKRGGNSQVDNRIVTQFLADVGGFSESKNTLLILGATNKPWDIDEAVFRTGRFDEKIYISPPDHPARHGILQMEIKGVNMEAGFDAAHWAERLDGYSGSDIVGIMKSAKRISLGRAIREDADAVLKVEDVEGALNKIPSSITDRMLKEYEKFREQRFS
ncbi:MAG: ATP-binding protein [Lentisphaerae bacterium]|nr:ATP-binding protein [Lentisphaerota bacterium]